MLCSSEKKKLNRFRQNVHFFGWYFKDVKWTLNTRDCLFYSSPSVLAPRFSFSPSVFNQSVFLRLLTIVCQVNVGVWNGRLLLHDLPDLPAFGSVFESCVQCLSAAGEPCPVQAGTFIGLIYGYRTGGLPSQTAPACRVCLFIMFERWCEKQQWHNELLQRSFSWETACYSPSAGGLMSPHEEVIICGLVNWWYRGVFKWLRSSSRVILNITEVKLRLFTRIMDQTFVSICQN